MKRTLLLLFTCLLAGLAAAQTSSLKRAVARYAKVHRVEATTVRTVYSAAKGKSTTARGAFFMTSPDKVNITVNGGKDQLTMNGDIFTVTMRGKKHTTSAKKNVQMAALQQVLCYIMTGGKKGNINRSDISISQSGHFVTVTIKSATSKKKRRQLFSSVILSIDSRNSEIKSMRMNQRGNNYTNYEFSNYKFE
ncbi:MAG: outer membrane lipoprotein carrier protein LolA [Prevotella sp.]